MSNLDFVKSVIGKPIFGLPTGANNQGKQELKRLCVEKVGKKYITLDIAPWRYTTGNTNNRYLHSEIHRDYLLFETEQDYEDYKLKKDLITKIKSEFDHFSKPEKFTLQQVVEVATILEIEV